jgi:hypothetical protein
MRPLVFVLIIPFVTKWVLQVQYRAVYPLFLDLCTTLQYKILFT